MPSNAEIGRKSVSVKIYIETWRALRILVPLTKHGTISAFIADCTTRAVQEWLNDPDVQRNAAAAGLSIAHLQLANPKNLTLTQCQNSHCPNTMTMDELDQGMEICYQCQNESRVQNQDAEPSSVPQQSPATCTTTSVKSEPEA